MFQRAHLQILRERIEEPRRFIQVLFGPRQVGKTTIVNQLMEQLDTSVTLASGDDVSNKGSVWLSALWGRARADLLSSEKQEILLVIDEIQKIENWSETVKKEWDADTANKRNIKVVLLGSSSLLIQKGLTESLAGRFELIPIPHWSFQEMREAFGWTLDQFIYFGGYPGAAQLIDNQERWSQYVSASLVETSIMKDILMMTRIDKPELLRRLFEIGCSYSAQILSLNKMQGELNEKGNLATLANYLKLLSTAGLLGGLGKYCGSILRQRASKPKLQVYNNALLAVQSPTTFEETRNNHKLWGRFAESCVGAHLLNAAFERQINLYYWNENSREVDFVIERKGKIIAIEVKSGSDSTNEGLAIFREQYHPQQTLIVGTDGIPFEQFLTINPRELF